MELRATGSGGDFDAPVAQLVVFRREGVLIGADLEDVGLRGELPAGEAVYVNLPSIRPGRRPCQRLQLRLQILRIIRKRLEIFSLDHDRGGVVFRGEAQATGGIVYRDFLLFHRHLELGVHDLRFVRLQHDPGLFEIHETLRLNSLRIGAGRQALEYVLPLLIRLHLFRRAVGVCQRHCGGRNRRSRGVRNLTAQSAFAQLGEG